MKSYKAIAEETGTTVAQVCNAMHCAGRTHDTCNGRYAKWHVCLMGVGYVEGWGATREEAVIDALTSYPERFF